MGITIGFHSCGTRYQPPSVPTPPPNPSPDRWTLLDRAVFDNGYVLRVRYHDCINYEGVKVMVYRGVFKGVPNHLDPHFQPNNDSPIARFRPDADGWSMACTLANTL